MRGKRTGDSMIQEQRLKYERAREQGRQAFRGCKKEAHCPYRRGTLDMEREAWLQGYGEAKSERRRV